MGKHELEYMFLPVLGTRGAPCAPGRKCRPPLFLFSVVGGAARQRLVENLRRSTKALLGALLVICKGWLRGRKTLSSRRTGYVCAPVRALRSCLRRSEHIIRVLLHDENRSLARPGLLWRATCIFTLRHLVPANG